MTSRAGSSGEATLCCPSTSGPVDVTVEGGGVEASGTDGLVMVGIESDHQVSNPLAGRSTSAQTGSLAANARANVFMDVSLYGGG